VISGQGCQSRIQSSSVPPLTVVPWGVVASPDDSTRHTSRRLHGGSMAAVQCGAAPCENHPARLIERSPSLRAASSVRVEVLRLSRDA
jgi:hypothetical protein